LSFRAVLERAVNQKRVMECGVPFFQFDRNGFFKGISLVRSEDLADGIHVAGQSGDWQQVPLVAAGKIVEATVVNRGILQGYPAS